MWVAAVRNKQPQAIILAALLSIALPLSASAEWDSSYCERAMEILTGEAPLAPSRSRPGATHIQDRSVDAGQKKERKLLARYLGRELTAHGLKPKYQRFQVIPREDVFPLPTGILGHEPVTLTNVIARIEPRDSDGTGNSQRPPIVIGAHYDVVNNRFREWRGRDRRAVPRFATPGADDNASGVVGVLELARRLVAHPLLRTPVIIVLFDGEETGFYGPQRGSAEFVRALRASGVESIRQSIILDMIGRAPENYPRHYSLSLGNTSQHDQRMIHAILSHDDRVVAALRTRPDAQFMGMLSDGKAFLQQKWASILFADLLFKEEMPSYYHTEKDSIDVIDWDYLGTIVDNAETLMRSVFD